MPRPKVGDKRAAILAATIEALAEDGTGASTAKIAKVAAVAEGSLFRYFEDKDTLLNELYLELKLDVQAVMTTRFPVSGSLRRRMQHMWNAYVAWGMASPSKRKAMIHLNVSERITDESKEEGQVGFEHAIKAMQEFIDQGRLRKMPQTFASNLLLAMAETTMTSMSDSPADADRYRKTGFEAFEALLVSQASHRSTFCFGDAPGLADICLVPQVTNAGNFGLDMTPYPNINSVVETCMALPAFAQAHPKAQPDFE